MSIRLNKVLTELNIGLQTAVDFLKNKKSLGEIRDDANLSTKISDEQYDALVAQFKGDKVIKNEADKMFAKKGKDKKAEKKATSANDLVTQVTKFKPLGKIDLDNLGKQQVAGKSAVQDGNAEQKTAAVSQSADNQTAPEPVIPPSRQLSLLLRRRRKSLPLRLLQSLCRSLSLSRNRRQLLSLLQSLHRSPHLLRSQNLRRSRSQQISSM